MLGGARDWSFGAKAKAVGYLVDEVKLVCRRTETGVICDEAG